MHGEAKRREASRGEKADCFKKKLGRSIWVSLGWERELPGGRFFYSAYWSGFKAAAQNKLHSMKSFPFFQSSTYLLLVLFFMRFLLANLTLSGCSPAMVLLQRARPRSWLFFLVDLLFFRQAFTKPLLRARMLPFPQ